MTRSRGILPPRRFWTDAEDAVVRELYPDTQTAKIAQQLGRPVGAVYQRAQSLGLKKSERYLASPDACRLRRGDHIGRATQFKKGQEPPNKGLRRPGYAPGRMAETQFRKGERRGVAVKLYKPIGSERVSKDGYLERKTHDELPEGISREDANRLRQRRWKAVHNIVWEEANGAVPKGYAVTFVNGDKTDIRLENLTLVSRADLMRRNTIHNLPPELASAAQLIGQLKRRIREEQDRRSA
jgi:hypothetical protein